AASLVRLHHPRGDSELADLEVGIRLHQHAGRGEQRVLLAARVLGEVLLQLRLEVALVRVELLAVLRREVDRVLVRDVDPGDGDRAVLVHLLGKFPRELDGLHVRAECPAEDALEQGLDLLLDRAENHLGGGYPPAGDANARPLPHRWPRRSPPAGLRLRRAPAAPPLRALRRRARRSPTTPVRAHTAAARPRLPARASRRRAQDATGAPARGRTPSP